MNPVLISVHNKHSQHEFDGSDPERVRRSISRRILLSNDHDDSDEASKDLLDEDPSNNMRDRDFVFDWKFGLDTILFERGEFESREDMKEDGECPISNNWTEHRE